MRHAFTYVQKDNCSKKRHKIRWEVSVIVSFFSRPAKLISYNDFCESHSQVENLK